MRRWKHRRQKSGLGSIRFEIPPYRRRKFISLMIIGVFLLSLAFSLWLLDTRLRPSLTSLALARAKILATAAVTEAIVQGDARAVRYQDLIAVKLDQQGRPVLLQPNTGELNRLAAQITLDVQRQVLKLERSKIRLPIGQVLGMKLLGAWGPKIGVTIMPIGTVEGRIIDSFDVAGINQTRHRILARITTEIKVVVPFVAASAKIDTDVALAEAVIMGEVPRVYLGDIAARLQQ